MGELYGKRKAGELVKIEPEGTVKKPAFHVPMALSINTASNTTSPPH